jgi:hypothetical protein
MFRDVPAYRHLVEICYSGLEEEEKIITRLVAAHQDRCTADGIQIGVVRRGVVPGQIMITVGGGAELHGIGMVEWMERNGAPDRVEVYIHPHCLARPMFFLLPREAAEAKRHLRWILSAREVPAETAQVPAGILAGGRATAGR